MSALRLSVSLAAKDWRLFWADRRAALLAFLVPVILASAFGTLFQRAGGPATGQRLPLLVVCEDDSRFAAEVMTDLLASPRLQARPATADEIPRRLAARSPAVAVVLPAGFGRLAHWQPGRDTERPAVRILHHPTATAERLWAEGTVTEVVMRRLARQTWGDWVGGAAEVVLTPPFQIEGVTVSAGGVAHFNSYSHSFCGMTLQYLLFWGMESGLLFLRERRRGVWLRTRAAPVPLAAILAGKTLATTAVALLQVLVTFGFGYLAFGVRVTGSVIGFVLLCLAVCGLAAATGLVVAAVGGTEARARNVSILIILSVSMLGGLWMPSFLLPEWLSGTALSLPTAWAMRGLSGVTWEGLGLAAVWPCIAVVAAFTLVFFVFAVLRLDRSERLDRKGE